MNWREQVKKPLPIDHDEWFAAIKRNDPIALAQLEDMRRQILRWGDIHIRSHPIDGDLK